VNQYGAEAVEKLERRAQFPGGYKTFDLLLMAKEYRAKTKLIKEEKKNG